MQLMLMMILNVVVTHQSARAQNVLNRAKVPSARVRVLDAKNHSNKHRLHQHQLVHNGHRNHARVEDVPSRVKDHDAMHTKRQQQLKIK